MPTYEITIPGSGIYRVESSTKLTDDQAYQEALKQATPRTTGEQVKHVLGVATRGVAPVATGAGAGFLATGGNPLGALAGSLALPLSELTTQGINLALPKNYQIPSPTSAVENLMTKAGLPSAENLPERLLQSATGAVGGVTSQIATLPKLAKTASSELTRNVATQLSQAPGRQLAAAAPSAAAAQFVGEETGNPLLGAGAGMVAGAPFGVGARTKFGPTSEQLAAKANAAYTKAGESGVQFDNRIFRTSMAGIVGDLRKEGYTPTAYPKIEAITKELTNGRPKDFVELQALRKIIQGAQGSADGTERMLATTLKDKFDDYVSNAPASHFTGTNNKEGLDAWKAARTDYSRMKKGEIFEDMLFKAELDKSKFTQSGAENSMAQQLRNLAGNKSKMRMFTEEEQKAIIAASKGGNAQNLFKFFGRFAPTGPVSSIFTGGLAAYEPTIGVPVALGALASRAAATQMRKNSIENLGDIMRSGGAKPPSMIPVPMITGTRGLLSPQVPLYPESGGQ